MDFNKFQGCTVYPCARQTDGIKKKSNYLIEETCRYAEINVCIYPPVSRKYIGRIKT